MDRVKRNVYFLRYLSTGVSCAQRQSLIETASVDQIVALAEIAYNILGGVFDLTASELSSLQRYKSVIRKLASKAFRPDEKRAALLVNTIAVKHLLTVFFRHNGYLKYELGRDQTTDSHTPDTVSAAGSESEEDSDDDTDER